MKTKKEIKKLMHIKIDPELHMAVKQKAVLMKGTIQQVVETYIKKGLSNER